jgi:hypothetical protein
MRKLDQEEGNAAQTRRDVMLNQSFIITALYSPPDRHFGSPSFTTVSLGNRGMIIHPGKTTKVDTFRVGAIECFFDNGRSQLSSYKSNRLNWLEKSGSRSCGFCSFNA